MIEGIYKAKVKSGEIEVHSKREILKKIPLANVSSNPELIPGQLEKKEANVSNKIDNKPANVSRKEYMRNLMRERRKKPQLCIHCGKEWNK